MDLRDSWLGCARCGKRMVIDPSEEEGQAIVTHRCVSCDFSCRAPGQRSQRTTSPTMASLRQRAWAE